MFLPATGLCTTAVEYYNSGRAYKAQKAYPEAIRDYTNAIAMKPDFYQAYYARGNVYKYQKDYPRAIQDYSKAIEINPDFYQAYNNRGNTFKKQKKYQKAIQDLTRAVAIKADYHLAYNNRGNSYKALGQYPQALQDYGNAIAFKPDYAPAYYNRGNCYKAIGKFPLALQGYSRAIELKPDFYQAYNGLGRLYAMCKEKKYRNGATAVKFSLKAVSLKKYDNTLNTLASAYVEDKQYEKAVETYIKAMENSSSRTKKYQSSLKKKGYYSGPVNGIKTLQLEQAIKACVNNGYYL